jgi:iron(III) transport system substrate-binding protein
VVYGGSLLGEDRMGRFIEAFPDVDYQFVDVRTVDLAERVLGELRAERHIVDVIGSSTPSMYPLDAEGVFAAHHSAPIPDGFPRDRARPRDVDFRTGPYVIAWNRDRIRAEDAPREWDDFVDPEHTGCVMNDASVSWFAAMIDDRGFEAMEAWVDAFVANGGQVRSGFTATMSAMAAGEVDCMVAVNVPRAEQMIVDDGAPIEWHAPAFVPVIVSSIAIARHAPNPHAAALFVTWLLGPDGAVALAENGELPLLPGTPSPYPRLEAWVEPGSDLQRRMHFVDADTMPELEEQATALLERMLDGAGVR